jgi:hypothetical protein
MSSDLSIDIFNFILYSNIVSFPVGHIGGDGGVPMQDTKDIIHSHQEFKNVNSRC